MHVRLSAIGRPRCPDDLLPDGAGPLGGLIVEATGDRAEATIAGLREG